MNHTSFMPYHNKHIQFSVNNGPIISGVLFDSMRFREDGQWSTEYTFVPTRNMIDFKKTNDLEEQKKLSSQVDIKDITWVDRMPW